MFEVNEIVKQVGGELGKGDGNLMVTKPISFDSAESADSSTITWISDKRADSFIPAIKNVVLCSALLSSSPALVNSTIIVVDNPRRAFLKVLQMFDSESNNSPSVNVTARISTKNVEIGEDFNCESFVTVERNVRIGKNVSIGAGSVIKARTIIGDNVKIGANCTIGGMGFGYEKDENGSYVALPHLGGVWIYENVEIGNNTCIDRAVLGYTILRENVKVDNLVHIAHGCDIGRNSLIIANAMIAGSVKIGEGSWIAPSSSILNKKTIGDNVTVGMAAVVLKDVEDNDIVAGLPAKSLMKK